LWCVLSLSEKEDSAPPLRTRRLCGELVLARNSTAETQNTQSSIAATKTIVVSHGFAASCEEWLCLSVKLTFSSGLRPYFEGLPHENAALYFHTSIAVLFCA
jgi:hypothetical protein